MKCHEFETSITELLNGRLERQEHGEALAHIRACTKCAATLESQRELGSKLLALALEPDSEQLPPHFEQRLVSAFRTQSEGWGNSIPGPSSAIFQNWRPYATAMVGLIVGMVALYFLVYNPGVSPSPAVSHPATAAIQRNKEVRLAPPLARAQEARRTPQGAPAKSRLPRPPAPEQWVNTEVATDFYAIPYVEPFQADERIRVVRTQVPRSVLSSFGLPVDSNRAFDPLQADVLVGNDNVARAIRFVQEWQLPRPASRPVSEE